RSRCRRAGASFRPVPSRANVPGVRAVALVFVLATLARNAGAERAIEVAGYLGRYDPATVALWPRRLQLLMGRPDVEGRLIVEARATARAAGNPARFFFYLSFSSLDGR